MWFPSPPGGRARDKGEYFSDSYPAQTCHRSSIYPHPGSAPTNFTLTSSDTH